jgi:hypothetical protein
MVASAFELLTRATLAIFSELLRTACRQFRSDRVPPRQNNRVPFTDFRSCNSTEYATLQHGDSVMESTLAFEDQDMTKGPPRVRGSACGDRKWQATKEDGTSCGQNVKDCIFLGLVANC